MEIKQIGDFPVHPLGIGTWTMGGAFLPDKSSPFVELGKETECIEAIRYSISKGQNHIDTAFSYGLGHAEEIVGTAIKGFDRKKLFLASKVWKSHLKRDSVIRGIQESLTRLQTDYLDLIYLHAYWEYEPLEDQIGGLNDAVDRGLVKAIGLSNYNLDQLKRAMTITKHPIVALQNVYNILSKKDVSTELFKFCHKNNISIVAYRPVERKLLADKCTNEVVLAIAKKYGKTPAQIALNWLISQPGVVAIPKAVGKSHIDENLGSLEFEMDKSDQEKLSAADMC